MALALTLPMKVDMPLNKETKPNLILDKIEKKIYIHLVILIRLNISFMVSYFYRLFTVAFYISSFQNEQTPVVFLNQYRYPHISIDLTD